MTAENKQALDAELASLATKGEERIVGFKIGGLFPLSLRFIRVDVHIQLCAIKSQIHALTPEDVNPLEQFHNPEFQSKYVPLLLKYLEIGLLNGRYISWLIRPLLRHHLSRLSYYEILFKYFQIVQKDDPAYFFVVWTSLRRTDNTLSKAEEQ